MSYENNVVISSKNVVSIDAKTYFNISHKVVIKQINCSQFVVNSLFTGGGRSTMGDGWIYIKWSNVLRSFEVLTRYKQCVLF